MPIPTTKKLNKKLTKTAYSNPLTGKSELQINNFNVIVTPTPMSLMWSHDSISHNLKQVLTTLDGFFTQQTWLTITKQWDLFCVYFCQLCKFCISTPYPPFLSHLVDQGFLYTLYSTILQKWTRSSNWKAYASWWKWWLLVFYDYQPPSPCHHIVRPG